MNNVDFTNFLNSILASITTTQILNILASVIGVGMIFFLMWFGVRKITTQFTEMVAFGKWALTGKEEAWDKFDNIRSAREAGMSVEDYKKWSNEILRDKPKTIGNNAIAPRPIEPVEPSGKPMTKAQRKEFDDYYATHDMYGHKLGYDKRVWENYYKKNANKYKKKYNNYKKNYYYDSYGNKYYK